MVANLFIEKINEVYAFPPNFGPQPVDLEEVADKDPLVPGNITTSGDGAPALMSIDVHEWEQMISILSPDHQDLEAVHGGGGPARPVTRGWIRLPAFRLMPGPAFAPESPRQKARPGPASRGEGRMGRQ